ncbi:microvitellogenin [Bombyx mori]|uniref:Microvitellogenin-like n=1 Tax=Bombyx mori TaxID=7091 RepID=A0A8R2DPG3_BOMMO|nr:microvitellogenin [Bombyx mori]
MKLLLVLAICVLAIPRNSGAVGLVTSRDRYVQIIYDAVNTEDYAKAVTASVHLRRETRGDVVVNAVTRLIEDGKRNILEFAYKLWKFDEGQQVVKELFPAQFKLIFSGNLVKIITIRDDLALKLAGAADELNDRAAYGDGSDKTSENISWKFVPIWEDNRVYFKIFNIRRRQYLKLGVDADGENDHAVFGDNFADTRRHEWYLKPVQLNGKLLFYIYNRQYNQGLKLSRTADSAGDRRAYSNAGEVDGQPELFGWSIVSFY